MLGEETWGFDSIELANTDISDENEEEGDQETYEYKIFLPVAPLLEISAKFGLVLEVVETSSKSLDMEVALMAMNSLSAEICSKTTMNW